MIIIKPKVNIILLISVIAAAFCLFAFPRQTLCGAADGVEICIASLIPSLFPFMALATFIMRTNALYLPLKILGKPAMRIFKMSENAVQIILLSLIGGYPVGEKITSDAFFCGDISQNEAKRLCIFCMNPGPAFTVTAIGVGIYGSAKAGAVIYASLCISSLTIGFLTRFFCDENKNISRNGQNLKLVSAEDIIFSVQDAFAAVMRTCAWVILFAAFTACIKEKLGFAGEAISAIAEVTSGVLDVSQRSSVPVVTALCGFGGFCVHCQVLKYLRDCSLNYKVFFAGRLLNASLSAAICYLILYFFPIEIGTAYTFTSSSISAVSVSAPAAITFIFMCCSMIFGIDRKGKVC